ncbi:hypothetical protein [Spiroplasma endosymbiont of Nebria brevicollis]|uniref:hypothetical protein n=1 Tax=Spiroplasma endosymbiont of Nebria brevicollis TaxID=3066284 RepID=UPI00313E0694
MLLTDSTQNSRAANTESYDFITSVLGVKPISGNDFATGIFDITILNNIKGYASNPKISLVANKKLQDYTVSAGTFDFQFKDDKDNIKSPVYSFNVKPDDTRGVINDIISRSILMI